MITIMTHKYQNTPLKLTILDDLGQWQLHIIYNILGDLHLIAIDLYHQ